MLGEFYSASTHFVHQIREKEIHYINTYSDLIPFLGKASAAALMLFVGKASAIVYYCRSTLLCTIDVIPSTYSQHLYYQNNINVFTLPYTLPLSSFLPPQVLYFYYIITKLCIQPSTSSYTFQPPTQICCTTRTISPLECASCYMT